MRVFITNWAKELINLSGRHEATKIISWKLVRLPYCGMTVSHSGFLYHWDHFYELKLILVGKIETKLLNLSLYFSSIHEGKFFYNCGGILPTNAANYYYGIIYPKTYFMITSPNKILWDFSKPIDMLSYVIFINDFWMSYI